MPRPKPAPQRGYYRFPAISGDRIVFCSDSDLWMVSAAGGTARRLTAAKAIALRPCFSPDGEWIAFTGSDEGGTEIYRMPAAGGEAERLTHLSAMTYTLGWSADGKRIQYASDAGQAFMGDHNLYTVPAAGGPPRALGLGPARGLARAPDGKGMVIARNGGDPARWKRYRGGTVGTLWVDAQGQGNFRRILKNLNGNLASPMWIGKRIYFISDHEGIGNIYSCLPTGRNLARHTDHQEFYARFASTDGRRIVYHAGADIHLFDPGTGEDLLVDIEIHSSRPERQRKFVNGTSALEDYDPHPKGHSLLLTVRGRPVTMGLWEGPATEFGTPWRGRHRLARWLNDGKRFVAVTDEPGEEQLAIFTPGGGVKLLDVGLDLGRIIEIKVAPAPAGQTKKKTRSRKKKVPASKKPAPPDRILVTNQRQEVIIVNLTTKRAQVIDKSEFERIEGPCWSPDGQWIAYGLATGHRNVAIRIANAATGKTEQITSGDFIDYEPCFDPEGRYLYFLSLRTYDPVYDMVQFGLGFPRGARPYMVTLKADEPSPFLPAPRPLGGKPPGRMAGNNPWEIEEADPTATKAKADGKKAGEGPVKVKIDFEGIAERLLAFPIPEGRYFGLQAIAGKLFIREEPIEGALGMVWLGDPTSSASIALYDLQELKLATFETGITDFKICADGQTLLIRAGRRLRAVLASSEPGKLPAGRELGRTTGWIGLERVRCSVQPADEWRQMLTEAWRLQRDQYWVPDLAKIDWKGIHARYLPLIERLSTRAELSDLLWEMQGELGTSHAYEFGGDYPAAPRYPVGKLGADLRYNAKQKQWEVARLPQGDSWDPKAASPLAGPGMGIRPGTVIHAINGRELGPDLSPAECLVHLAGQEIWLTVSAGTGKPRSITLKTLGQEYALRYRDWVEGNRAFVHAQSMGQVGYVHIPNMGPLGYSEFHRYFLAECGYTGLIVDVRHNGGGHVSSLLLDKLRRKRVGFVRTRYGGSEPYPSESPAGPMVALTDELAGSDGDIFSHCWKLNDLGPLIGLRTWGGVVGIWPRHPLVDGTITTQPEFSFWFADVGWGVENYGTDPDIEVAIRPQDYAAGKDPQIERGVTEVIKQLRRFKPPLPDMEKRPRLAQPKLPPRG